MSEKEINLTKLEIKDLCMSCDRERDKIAISTHTSWKIIKKDKIAEKENKFISNSCRCNECTMECYNRHQKEENDRLERYLVSRNRKEKQETFRKSFLKILFVGIGIITILLAITLITTLL